MKRHLLLLSAAGLAVIVSARPAWALTQCDQVVKEANAQLTKQGKATVTGDKKLTALLRTLNRDNNILPAEYVTRDKAIKQGWSGKDSDSLWDAWTLNNKLLGGDAWRGGPLPVKGQWLSADLDNPRGFRSGKQLVYSKEGTTRYLTSDNGVTFVTLAPCQ